KPRPQRAASQGRIFRPAYAGVDMRVSLADKPAPVAAFARMRGSDARILANAATGWLAFGAWTPRQTARFSCNDLRATCASAETSDQGRGRFGHSSWLPQPCPVRTTARRSGDA